jgi:DNA-binding transcriptional LysR family regulator
MDTSPALNPARIDFVTLRLFCAVARSGSITQGAAACHLALSAASRRIAEFEATAGAPLLLRSAQGVSLTPSGQLVLQHALRLTQGFEQFGSELSDHRRGLRGHVRLWAVTSALSQFLPQSLVSFLEANPGIRIETEEHNSGEIVRAVLDGVADIGVFAEQAPSAGLQAWDFQSDRLVLLCGRKHPLASRRKLHFEEALGHDFVGLERGSTLVDLLSSRAAQAGRGLRLRFQVRSFDAMCHMIAAGLGVGVAPLAASAAQRASLPIKALRLEDDWATRRLLIGVKADAATPAATGSLLAHLCPQARR